MAIIVMVYGESGSGKSTSLRNFKAGELSVINVSKKPMPFKADFSILATDDYAKIREALKASQSKSLCIDDATYLLVGEFMRTAKTAGFQKFTDMALNFYNLVKFCNDELQADKIVYFLGHVDRDQNGNEKFKTIGKLLDEKVTLEGMFTIVLKTIVQDRRYAFQTHTNGMDTVKSPFGMFESDYIPNDLKAVDATIRNFYGITQATAQ